MIKVSLTQFLIPMLVVALSTAIVLVFARQRHWLDRPNARSSHSAPTPTAGGVAFAVVMPFFWWTSLGQLGVSPILFFLGISVVAVIGFFDDLRPLPIVPRLITHFVAAALILLSMPMELATSVFSVDGRVLLGLALSGWVLGVWTINFFNFMDGIDGLVSAEIIFVGCVAGALSAVSSPAVASLWFSLAGAASGFLIWNRPPARIFMGDVGSGFFGCAVFALLALSVISGALQWLSAAILVVPFFADTTVTLIRRIWRGEPWYKGHRLHGYQRLALRWRSHARATGAFTLLNLAIVAPAAYLCQVLPETAPLVAALTAAFIVVLALLVGSGRRASETGLDPIASRIDDIDEMTE